MPQPPAAPRHPFTHSIHGHDRPDDYHWLKTMGKQSPEVLAYLEAENAYLEAVMAPHRAEQEALYQELRSYLQEEDEQPAVQEGDWLYFTRTEAGKTHPIYLRRPLSGGEAQVLLDLNQLKEREGHANVWVAQTRPSPDGRYLAYLLDTVGREQWQLRVLDLERGELLEPPLEQLSGWTLQWYQDSQHLIYATEDATQRADTLWRHRLRQPRHEDRQLWHEADPTFEVAARSSENGETLFLISESDMAHEWLAVSARDPQAEPQLLLRRERGTEIKGMSDAGDHWLVLSNRGEASEFTLLRFTKRTDGAPLRWEDAQEVWSHDPARYLTGFYLTAEHLVVQGREGGMTRLWVLPRQDHHYGPARRLEFSEDSYVVKLWTNRSYHTSTLRFTYTSLTKPTEYRDLDLNTLQTTLVKATPVPGYDPSLYQSQQMWALALDGERVPISLVRRRDTPLPAPTLLYGYGSYGASMDPEFGFWTGRNLPLLDRGWVMAIAHIRGGSELGRRWYDAGRLQHKMNTFTDFIAAGEQLRAQGLASELVAMGRSAGGLLMGAVINLRPELWKAAFVGVPFVDVLSTMLDDSIPLTTGEYDEWGNPSEPASYEIMRQYSPYDNLRPIRYPHLFISGGLNDPRVAYWEPAKYTARLRTLAQPGSGQIVLKTLMGAGHGGSSGRFEKLNEYAEELAFALAAVRDEL